MTQPTRLIEKLEEDYIAALESGVDSSIEYAALGIENAIAHGIEDCYILASLL